VDGHQDGNSIARSTADAPEIDGAVIITDQHLPIGEFAQVTITDADQYDLIATVA